VVTTSKGVPLTLSATWRSPTTWDTGGAALHYTATLTCQALHPRCPMW
jgi:hypothetical protein